MIDTSQDPIRYSVRPLKKYASGKVSYGKYDTEGVFSLAAPVIADVAAGESTAIVTWGTVPYARNYYVYIGKNTDAGIKWSKKAVVPAENTDLMQAEIEINPNWPYITVKAGAVCQGKTVISDFDTGYTLKDRHYEDQNILFLGDSIFYGMAYKNPAFTIPGRVQSLLGAYVYNGAIPGGSYADPPYEGKSIVRNCLEPIVTGSKPYRTTFARNGRVNPKALAEFDVIILGGGTNDYGYNIPLGTIDSYDLTTFYGAMDRIVELIREANTVRLEEGKKPAKVIYINLFFRNKFGSFRRLNNGYLYQNAVGLTLSDYNWAIEDEMENCGLRGSIRIILTHHLMSRRAIVLWSRMTIFI